MAQLTTPGPATFVDLGNGAGDVERLRTFYGTLYVAEFPDRDERESLGNMIAYLTHDGAFGNAYIVTLAYDGDALVGGAVCDYFVRSNCGVIEFLTVAPQSRGRGVGSALARHVERRMASAATAGRQSLGFVMAEINDPFGPGPSPPDNMDPVERLRFWARLGYRRVSFPYVQPPLSADQAPVRNLLLAVKTVERPDAPAIEVRRVLAFLHDYLVYAMRIDDPESSAEFISMRTYLESRKSVPLASFDQARERR